MFYFEVYTIPVLSTLLEPFIASQAAYDLFWRADITYTQNYKSRSIWIFFVVTYRTEYYNFNDLPRSCVCACAHKYTCMWTIWRILRCKTRDFRTIINGYNSCANLVVSSVCACVCVCVFVFVFVFVCGGAALCKERSKYKWKQIKLIIRRIWLHLTVNFEVEIFQGVSL
jgi:hypothetical protein